MMPRLAATAAPSDGATLGQLVADAAGALASAGIESARLDARILAAHALGVAPETPFLRPESPVAMEGREAFASLIRRRAAGEPVARILKRREFWSLEFEIGPAVLDPRPDSEILVQAVLDRLGDRKRPWRILDLGTGSGCLLLALLSELPAAQGIGLDRSASAAAMARNNANRQGLGGQAAFAVGDWATALAGHRYDVVISNPPYIPTGAIAGLAPDVAEHDPHLALDGGPDGLDCYRAILAQAPGLLAPGGFLAMEFGAGQDGALRTLAEGAGLAVERIATDLAGRPRCLLATLDELIGPAMGIDPETIGAR